MISVVDDDPSARKAISRLIRAAGHDAAAYESAEQFLADPNIAQSDCLILDVHLPGMSGLDLQIKLGELDYGTPIVFITAFDNVQARSQALSNGAVGFLQKPLDSERLLEVINEAVQRS